MMKQLKYFVCLIIFVFCGCIQTQINESGVINIDVKKFASVNDFIDSVSYIILETNDSALLNDEAKIHTSKDFIVAYSSGSGFVSFEAATGKHICSFDYTGGGPGEYSSVSDFLIADSLIYAVCGMQKKINVYSANDGAFQQSFSLPNTYSYAAMLDANRLVLCAAFAGESMNNFAIFNIDSQQIEREYMPFSQYHTILFGDYNAFIGSGNDCVYAALPFCNEVYKISCDTCMAVVEYKYNTEDKLPNIPVSDIDLAEMMGKYQYKRVVKWPGFFEEIDSTACYQSFSLMCDYGTLPFLSKYDPNTGKSITLRIGTEVYPGYPYFTFPPIEFSNGAYVCVAPAETILRRDATLNISTFSDFGVTEDSNPIIFFYHLKGYKNSVILSTNQCEKRTDSAKDVSGVDASIIYKSVDNVKSQNQVNQADEGNSTKTQLIMFQADIDVGALQVGDSITSELYVGNVGDNMYTLNQLKVSSNSIKARLEPDKINAHSEAKLYVTFHASEPCDILHETIEFVGNDKFKMIVNVHGKIVE